MNNYNPGLSNSRNHYYRLLILIATGAMILSIFWFTSRYPSLFKKASHVGQILPSMAYGSEIFNVASATSLAQQIFFGALNWLNGMKVGMTFGVFFGALLFTVLRYYPMRMGNNLYFNSLKGALIGVPMGVCANCSVPVACGLTRGHGRIEAALGFLFSSPNFNPIIVMMTFSALPWTMGVAKYAMLLIVILVIVPFTLSIGQPKIIAHDNDHLAEQSTSTTSSEHKSISVIFKEIALEYFKSVWMLAKPTIVLMLIASVVASALLTLLPWQEWLAEATPVRLALVSLISVFMPVPIALDVMFAAQLQQQGVAASYVALFSMTLGTFSIVPSIYLWREVSKRLAVVLFVFFLMAGWLTSLFFL